MSRFVPDNTVTMGWCFTDEATPFKETLLSRLSILTDSAIVPALWLYEVVNVTGLAVRKGRITEDKSRAFIHSNSRCAWPDTRTRNRPAFTTGATMTSASVKLRELGFVTWKGT